MVTMPQFRRRALAAAALVPVALLLAPAARAQAPTPAPEIQRLAAIAGAFEGEATYTAGGRTVRFRLHHVNRVISGGFGLAAHEEADVPGLGHYEAENLFGWDAGRRRLHLFSVTSDPNTHDHSGPWIDATHARLRYEGLRDGKRLVEVIPFELVSANEYRFRSTTIVAGGPPEILAATMKRVDGMAKR